MKLDPSSKGATVPARLSQGSPIMYSQRRQVNQDFSSGYGFGEGYSMKAYSKNQDEAPEEDSKNVFESIPDPTEVEDDFESISN